MCNKSCSNVVFLRFCMVISHYSPLMAATPGSTVPSMASSNSPPPVEMYDTLSAKPNLLTQATESPPPISENAPFAVASAIAAPMAREPAVNSSTSNTPAGPFQRMVLAPLMAAANAFWLSGPASKPSQPAGISLAGAIFISAPAFRLMVSQSMASLAMTASVPSTRFTPFALAFLMTSSATSNLSSSQMDSPTVP